TATKARCSRSSEVGSAPSNEAFSSVVVGRRWPLVVATVVMATGEPPVLLGRHATLAVWDHVVASAAFRWLVAVGVGALLISHFEDAAQHALEGALAGGPDGPQATRFEQHGFELGIVEPRHEGGRRHRPAGCELTQVEEPLRSEDEREEWLRA